MTGQNAARADAPSALSSKQAPIGSSSSLVPWRQRPLLQMTEAAQIAGVSVAKLYHMAGRGQLVLKKFGGRTMAETASLVAALDAAEDWSASSRTEKANAARAERSRAAWAE